MWTVLMSCREAREFCAFYLKLIALLVFIFHNLISQGKCHESGRGKRGDYCKMDEDCDGGQFLQCVANYCDCRNWKTWVSEENSCMIMPDAPCGRYGPRCITNSSCIAGKCNCDDGFLWNKFSKCELSYGSVCSESEKCASLYLLECTKSDKNMHSECKCKSEYVWDENKEKCVSTAGGSCDIPGNRLYGEIDQLECIENTDCAIGPDGNGYCKCKPGFIQTPEGTCMLEYGEKCNSSVGLDCNRHQFLLCRDGRCGCEFFGQMKYDIKAQECRVLAGETCHIGRDPYESNRDNTGTNERLRKCITDSSCEPQQGSRSNRLKCTCSPGLVQLKDKTCSRYNKGHGLPCSTSIDCDKEKFLECVWDENEGGRCKCLQNDMYFDGKECRVRVGRHCTENKLCPNNSYCDGDRCVCEYGYKIGKLDCIPEERTTVQNSPISEFANQGQIQPPIAIADQTNCNHLSQGTTEWNRCRCQFQLPSHKWIQEECLALVGINCFQDSDCVPNAICVHEKICQCSAGTHTTKDRTCELSMNSNDPVDEHRECTEFRTLKSVRSQDEPYNNGVETQGYNSNIIFLVNVVGNALYYYRWP